MANIFPKNYPLGNVTDVQVTTTTQSNVYKLGDEVDIWNDTLKTTTKYMYIYARNALAQYGLYQVTYAATDGQCVGCATLPSSSAVYILTGVPQVAIASGSYGWVAIKGYCNITSTTDVTAGEYGDAIKSIATCTDSGSTATIYSVCLFEAARTGSGTVACNLIGNRINVAA